MWLQTTYIVYPMCENGKGYRMHYSDAISLLNWASDIPWSYIHGTCRLFFPPNRFSKSSSKHHPHITKTSLTPRQNITFSYFKYIYIYIYIPQTELALMGSGGLKGERRSAGRARLGVGENNEFRRRIINIDVFEPPVNRYGKVARPRALQPQQHFPAWCLQKQCETHYFPNLTYKNKCFSSCFVPDIGFQT